MSDESIGPSELRVAELVEEYRRLRSAGRGPSRDAYLAAHSEFSQPLREALDGLDLVEGLADVVKGKEAEPPRLDGQVLGDYRIAREIGRGGMGVVYDAQDQQLDRRVALKVLPAAALLEPRHLQRFRHEARAAARLHHTNIVPVFGVGVDRGLHYYAMQFIDGVNLGEAVRALRETEAGSAAACSPSPLSIHGSHRSQGYVRAVCRVGIQAAEGLDYAHEAGVVHRDIKPANIMLDANGHVSIMDFGLASFQDAGSLTASGDIVGTARYMSPEQAAARPTDRRTDIYSLGITLHELLTLEPAFGESEAHVLLQRIVRDEPPSVRRRNASVPAELDTILVKATAKEIDRRYATAGALADDLRRFLDHRPILARRPTLLDRARKLARRHRGLVSAAVVLLIVAVIGLGVATALIARAKQRAEGQTVLAEERLTLAIQSVDEMLLQVGDEWLADVPLMAPIRLRLLKKARDFHLRLLEADRTDQAMRRRVAEAQLRVAMIQLKLGETDASANALSAAADHFRALEDRGALSNALRRLAGIRAMTDLAAARRLVEEAIELEPGDPSEHYGDLSQIAKLQGAQDESISLRRKAAQHATAPARRAHHLSLLGLALDHVDAEASKAHHRDARILFEQLLAIEPADDLQEEFARAVRREGWHYFVVQDDVERARASSLRAARICESLAARHPSVPRHRRGCAANYVDLAYEAMKLERPAEAVSWDEKAVAAQEGIVSQLPGSGKARAILVGYLRNLGIHQVSNRRWRDAERSFLRGLDVANRLHEESRGAEASRERRVNHRYRSGSVIYPMAENPDYHDVRYNAQYYAGIIHAHFGRHAEHEAMLRARADTPRLSMFLSNCADPAFRDLDEALSLAQLGTKNDPNQDDSWRALALAHHRRGEWRAAVSAIEQAMEVDRSDDIDKITHSLIAAMAHARLRENDEASAWYEKAVQAIAALEASNDGWDIMNRAEVEAFRVEAAETLGQ